MKNYSLPGKKWKIMKFSDLIPGRASRRRREEEVRLLRTRMAQFKSGWPNNEEDYELGDVIGTY